MSIEELRKSFTGTIVSPEDSAYENVQSTLFAKGAPAVVLQVKSNDDVVAAVKYAQENKLKLSVRSGGHSGAGFSTNTDGVVIDLAALHAIEVLDAKKHIVRIGGGAKWIDVAKALHKHGLALSSGDTKTVGVGGLTLGAGIGWMLRKFGMAIDSLVAAEIVLADGRVVRADAKENAELFWALRGGGGNFGVVTAFEFEAHPVGKVYAGTIMYGLDDVPRIIKGWRDAMRNASNDLTTMLLVMPAFFEMPPSAMVMAVYAGDDKVAADKELAPFRNLGKVQNDTVELKEYFEVLEDAHPLGDMRVVTKNGFVNDFTDELADTIAAMFAEGKTGPVLQIRSLGGVAGDVAPDATAFAHRSAEALIVSPVFLQPGSTSEDETKALENWRKIEPFTDGGYIGFYTNPDEAVSLMYPGDTYDRLAKVKKKYDPNNLFDQNYNIKPA